RNAGDPAFRAHTLEDAAEYLATNVGSLGFVVGHNTLGGGQDRHTEAIRHLRNILYRRVHAAAGTGNALDGADHAFVLGVLEFNLVLGGTVLELGLRIAADETLGLENVQHATAKGRCRRRNGRFATLLSVADAGQHIADGIGKAHCLLSLPARLDQTRDLTQVAQLTQGDTAHLELAIVTTRTT